MDVVLDIEANGLHDPTKIWCICCVELDSGKVVSFVGDDVYVKFPEYAKRVDRFIGHNIIAYDALWINTLIEPNLLKDEQLVDTLIISQLLHFKADNGHSLEAWGHRLNFPKGEYNIWDRYTPEMLTYCINDTVLTEKVFKFLQPKIKDVELAVEIEHYTACRCRDLKQTGFAFDIGKARDLHFKISAELKDIDTKLVTAFPPKAKFLGEYTPKLTKHNTISKVGLKWLGPDLSIVTPGCSFSRVEWVPFDPNSPKQMVDRLWDAGWKPTDKTKGHLEALKERDKEKLEKFKYYGWKVNETNLATLPDTAPEAAKLLVKRMLLASRLSDLDEWMTAYNVDGRIHGTFNTIGTWTHRMSHRNPNMGNIAAVKSIKYKTEELSKLAISLGADMRSMWQASSNNWLVGTDADGIQLRIFAHYINDKAFSEAIISGNSKLGTDAHSLNAKILGCERDTAKTFIYAFLLGAGDAKIGEILGVSKRAGADAKQLFIKAYPGLEVLREQRIPNDARRGFFVGFDGRKVPCDSEHLMLAGYLQNGEACIMKHALKKWKEELNEQNKYVYLVNFVHDEWQSDVRGTEEFARHVGEVQADSIKRVGESFKLNIEFKGNYKLGRNWYETH